MKFKDIPTTHSFDPALWDDEAVGPVDAVVVPCPGCGKPVTTYWMQDNTGCLPGDYDLIADTAWHKPCWDKQVADYNPEEPR